MWRRLPCTRTQIVPLQHASALRPSWAARVWATAKRSLIRVVACQDKGFGALLVPDWDTNPTLGVIAELVARNFDCHPRVWGDPERQINRIAFLNGSWSDSELYERCVDAGIDCMIVGETRYHLCVDAQPYLSVIELGHDCSELPIVDVLIDALLACGIVRDDIVDLRGSHRNWWTA